jgi:hypothetical protein
MRKRSAGLVLLASALVILGVASAASFGSIPVMADLGSGVGVEVSDVGPWALSIGPNTINNFATIYQLGGSGSVTWYVFASASYSGKLTSISVPTDNLGLQLKVNGVSVDATSLQVATGSIGADSTTQVNLPLTQQVAYTDKPHDDYHLTLTYTITP